MNTNQCMARAVVAQRSKMEPYPSIVKYISRQEAIDAYRKCSRKRTGMNKSVFFEADGIAYQVFHYKKEQIKYALMSYHDA
jgi:hypothetical protein